MRRYVFAAILASSVSPASSARLVNGSFEQSTPATVTQTLTLSAGSTALPGWIITSGNIDLVSTYWKASSGGRSIDLSGTERGTISTTVYGTIIGRTYDVRFDMAANPEGQPNAKVIRVSAGLDSANFNRNRAGGSLSAMNWATMLFSFTSSAVDQLLTFRAVNGTASGAAIDNVRVSLQPIPLPATAPLALLGLAGLALLRRRKAPPLVRMRDGVL
ncbi:MAG: PEP-CTERM sorting domain-containing protein [Rhodobacteraceae bacterium PARR1]|nr:MAG: PEP-CTERM sorting domain-containing protein [Rhodobacteraceae bacterium PARR1]